MPIQVSRILSIQSHVVSGYCGNKSATFPLQLLGFDMDVINSVQLSNHTQYKVARGQIYGAKDIEEISSGLIENGFIEHYDAILSGYVGTVDFLKSMAKLVSAVCDERRRMGQECLYALDPVLGDDTPGFYVSNGPEMAATYQSFLFPLADIITPNRFEASILSGITIDTASNNVFEQVKQAIHVFHQEMKIPIVVITSFGIERQPSKLHCILSFDPKVGKRVFRMPHEENLINSQRETWIVQIPKLDCPFTGTGDLFTALLTGWLIKSRFNFKESLENTANSVQDILLDTHAYHLHHGANSVRTHELRIIQNKDKILNPSKSLKAERFDVKIST